MRWFAPRLRRAGGVFVVLVPVLVFRLGSAAVEIGLKDGVGALFQIEGGGRKSFGGLFGGVYSVVIIAGRTRPLPRALLVGLEAVLVAPESASVWSSGARLRVNGRLTGKGGAR
ncbi:hypothetical protein ABENE_21735 [Asticcacaulis benevestitus DSM 16100 = ATCC BAA-896]|uniref:Uncharacterized protein n=1 Tax=Asticcacaulis benevestitus DSM 16100 = ATCC BAA-896 TaxID=1121022 RepID=V4P0G3_9CAUL|nr:hypothetical protein ABENE_21735 [Asticcacaulis benevestitus DSM 16100 = ATCC BAA-896]